LWTTSIIQHCLAAKALLFVLIYRTALKVILAVISQQCVIRMPVGVRRKPDRKSHGQYQPPSKWFIGSIAKAATPLYYK
jgi:hypothetical protein